MALVKKLDTGGSLDALNDELSRELGSYNLKSKDERKVRDALLKYRDYFASPEGKSITSDPLANKYTVTGIGSEQFAGSPDEIKSSWLTGKIKIDNDNDAQSVAAAIYLKAKKNLDGLSAPSSTGAVPARTSVNIGNLSNYVTDKIYGTEDNFRSSFGKLKTDDERKAKVYEFAQQKLNDYKTKANENKDIADYADLGAINDIQAAITSKDWDKFLEASYKVKWEPQKFLLTDEQKDQLAGETELNKGKEAVEKYKGLGITDAAFQQDLYNQGFTDEADQAWTPDASAAWFQGLLKSQGAKVLFNPTTKKHAIIKGNQFFDYGVSEQLAPGYGYSWKNSEDGGLHWYTPGSYKNNQEAFGADKYAEKNIGRELLTNLPGKVYGWSGNDASGSYNKDIIGRRDFTNTLIVEENGSKRYLIKQSDGSYKDKSTGEVIPVEIKGFGTSSVGINDYKAILTDTENPLSVIGPKEHYADIDEALSVLAAQKNAISIQGEYDEDEMNKLASHIRNVIGTSKNQDEKEKALAAYAELRELFKANDIPVGDDYTEGGFTFRKEGGIIRKAQKGMTFEEYNTKYKPVASAEITATAPSGKKAVSTKGMLKNMNALDYASLAGTGLAFIPGVGAIGGGIMTAADLANDIQRGESLGKTAANLGMNLGFTALAFFGAGGLKSIQAGAKLAKAGKVADAGFNFAKAGDKALKLEQAAIKMGTKLPEAVVATKRVTEVGKIVEPAVLQGLAKVDNITDLGKVLDKAQIDVLAKAGYIDDAGKVLVQNGAKVVNSDLYFAKAVSKSISSPALRTTKSLTIDPLKTLGSVAVKGGEKLLGNEKLRKAAAITMIGMGAKDAFDIGKTIAEAPSNLSFSQKLGRIKEEDLKGVMMAGAIGKGMWTSAKYNRALLNQTELTPITNEVRTITANGKSYPVTEKIQLPKTSAIKKVLGSKDDPKQIEQMKAELNAKLKGTDAEKKAMIDEILKDGKMPAEKIANNLVAAQTGDRQLKSVVNDRFNDPAKSMDEYALAKKIMERGITSPGKWNARPEWLGGAKAKQSEAKIKRAIKAITPERKAKAEALAKARKAKDAPKYLPAPTPSGVTIPKPAFIKPEPHKIDTQMVKKVNKNIVKGRGKKKEQFFLREGGILKLQNSGTVTRQEVNPDTRIFSHKSVPAGKLDFNERNKAGEIFAGDNYEKIWMPKVEQAFANPAIASQLINRLENYEGQDKDDVRALLIGKTPEEKLALAKRLATDKMVGPYHYALNEVINTVVPTTARNTTPITPLAPKTLAVTPKVHSAFATPAQAAIPKSGGDIAIQKQPGIWDKVKGYINPTDVSNLLMYANTYGTNLAIGNAHRRAISDSLYQLPYMPHQYMRIGSPNTVFAAKKAAEMRSQGNRIAGTTSNLEMSAATKLQAEKQAQGIMGEGQAADAARTDKLKAFQLENDAKVDQYNTGVLGKNRGLAGEAFKNTHLINANQQLAQNTALNNWILATNKNIPVQEYKLNQKVMYEAMRNPDIKKAVDEYTSVANDGYTAFENQFKAEQSRIGEEEYPYKSFETSPFYTKWQDQIKAAKIKVDNLYKPIQDLQLAQQFQQPLLWQKKGGTTLSKEDRMEIERAKTDSIVAMKETELVYKAILHNNEMLQKALIKVFK